MALSAGAREELAGILSGGAPGTVPQTRLKKPKSVRDEISAILNAPTEPGEAPPAPPPGPLENLKNLPKLITEGLPAAGRAFVQSQQEPTYGQALQEKHPAMRHTTIPAAMDLIARIARLPTSVGRGAAELGPERAKPLTEQLAGGLLNLSPLLRRPAAPRLFNVGEVPIAQPALLPHPLQRALGPSELLPPPPGYPGRYASWKEARRVEELLPHPPEQLPPGPIQRALPPMGPRGGRPMGPEEPGAGPNRNIRAEIEERLREAAKARTGRYAPETPLEVRGPPLGPENMPVLDAAGRPVKAPPPTMTERERLRTLYKGRLGDPKRSAQAPEPEPPLALSPPRVELPRRPPPDPAQTQIGDLPKPAMPTTQIRRPGQSALEDSPLFGQEKAARDAAAEKAQTTIPMSGTAKALSEMTPAEREAVLQARATAFAERGQEVKELAKKQGYKVGPEMEDYQRSYGRHAAAQKKADEKAAREAGKTPPPEGPVTTIKTRPGAFQIKGGFEHGIPSLKDPDDVYAIVQRAGRLKVGEDYAGELRDVSAFFKSKNGQTLDRIAEGLEEQYPALGDRGAIKEQLIDTLRRYPALKAEKKAKPVGPLEAAEQAKATEIRTGTPPGDVPVSADEWKVMGPVERKSAVDFFREAFSDESGRLDLAKMAAALKRFRQKLPMEEAVRKTMPNSPAISEVERWSTGLADGLQMVAASDWWKAIRKVSPEVLKDSEETMVRDWLSRLPVALRQRMRDPNAILTPQEIAIQQTARRQAIAAHASPELRASMAHRELQLRRENTSRRYFGLDDIPEESSPYLPRRTQAEAREAVSLGGGQLGVGRGLQASVRGHGKERVFETYRQGEAGGTAYEDPRNSILLREWEGLKLRATHRLFQNLETKGGLFRDKASAAAASPSNHPWRVDGAPGGGTWWTATEEEAKFLQQNLTESARGPLGSLVGYANALTRNPNLVNPMPHFAKNMVVKALLARGPVAPYTLARDAVEWARSSNPRMMQEFREAMPFSESGRTAGDVLGHELRNGSISDAVRGALRTLGMVNRPSQKVIFEWADPAMRYSLFKYYRGRGMGIYEAGNHAWTDLIRYGTRSTATDFWKSIPLNFFVPWRFGTMVSILKQATNHPIRTALLLGAIDYLREARYRATGKWTHLPQDYTEKPLATVLHERNPKDVASVLVTTALFGPGGDFSAKQLTDVLNAIGNQPHAMEVDRLKNAFWGISQIYNLPQEFARGDYSGMLATAILGEHTALTYQPRRLMRDLPESLPFMKRSSLVEEAERMQAEKRRKLDQAEERRGQKPRSTIEDKLRAAGYIK